MSITSTLSSSLRYFLSPVLGLLVLVSVCNPVFAAAEDPVVIQVGERVETLGEFEHQFEMAMVLTAVREGVPNKSGVLISDLRERFLKARVTELLLLAQKDAYSLEVSDAEVDAEMTDIIDQLTELYGNGNGVRADLSSQLESLRGYLREQLLINKIRQALLRQARLPSRSAAEESRYIADVVSQFREATVVKTWPDRILP